jgi:enoyl-CoA hydratase/carnithine racemase
MKVFQCMAVLNATTTGAKANMYQTLQYREDGAVAIIQLNRPQKKNSLNAQMRAEIETILHDLAQKTGIRVVVITGGDEIFCAGADISEIEATTSAEAAYKHARAFQILFDQVEALPQPVIAAVSGYAFGGAANLPWRAIFALLPRPLALVYRKSRSAPFPAAVARKDCRV